MEDKEKNVHAEPAAEEMKDRAASDAEIEEELEREFEPDDSEARTETAASAAAFGGAGVPAGAPEQAKRGGKAWIAVSAVLAAALVFVLIKPPFATGGEAVATVNGEKITKDELYEKLVEAGGKPTLDSMITERLVAQEVKKANVTVSDEEVNASVNMLIASYPSEADFEQALAGAGMTRDDLNESTVQQLELAKLLGDKAAVSDAEIKKFFDENKARFDTQEQVSAMHILVATKEEAEAVKKELEGGADFAELAKAKSTEPAAQQTGGDLGFFPRGQMDPAFEEAAFSQKVGELGIVQSSFGYHVLKVTDRKEAKSATLEEKRDLIREQLVYQKVTDNSKAYLEELRAKAKIDNKLEEAEEAASGASAPPSAPVNE